MESANLVLKIKYNVFGSAATDQAEEKRIWIRPICVTGKDIGAELEIPATAVRSRATTSLVVYRSIS